MRTIPMFLLAATLLGAFAGCQKQSSVPAAVEQAEKGGGTATSTPETALSKEFNVGDAETSVELVLELDPASASDSVKETTVLTAKKSVSQSNVTVATPFPGELWVRIRVRPSKPFIERTAVLRGVLTRDDTAIAQFNVVLGKYALENDPAQPKLFRVNVLADLPALPDTMLLVAKAEILLAPKGTDEATIDPLTLTADQGDTSAKLSNPLRISTAAPAPLLPTETVPAQ